MLNESSFAEKQFQPLAAFFKPTPVELNVPLNCPELIT
jgi:hypothetical protein